MMVLRALQRTAPVRAYAKITRDPSAADEVRDERRIDGSVRRDASEAREARRRRRRAVSLGRGAVLTPRPLGGRFHAPYLHWLHPWYEKMWLRYRIRSTVVKVALDQTLMAPPFLFCFLTYSALAEGSDPGPQGPGAAARALDR